MIRSKIALAYNERSGEQRGIIQIEIDSWNTLKEVTTFNVIDYAILPSGDKLKISEKQVNRPSAEVNSIDAYLETKNDFTGMAKIDKEYLKAKLGLLLETQSKPLYNSVAADWELTGV